MTVKKAATGELDKEKAIGDDGEEEEEDDTDEEEALDEEVLRALDDMKKETPVVCFALFHSFIYLPIRANSSNSANCHLPYWQMTIFM